MQKKVALLVGVSNYHQQGISVLPSATKDAMAIKQVLQRQDMGGFAGTDIILLPNPTEKKMKEAIYNLFAKCKANDLLLFYFSGHGLNGSFLPIDFDGFNNKISHEEIAGAFNKCKAKYKLCLADACHSGSILAMRSGETDPVLTQYYQTLAKSVSGTALIMSSKAEETSLESSGLRQGVFSHFLIRGLKGEADKNKDKIVSVQELYEFIAENVRAYTGNRQSPVIKGSYDPRMPVAGVR